MRRYSIIISGRVQGVGFRYFVWETAAAFDLTGWVRNNYDGTVEIEVQGNEKVLLKFIDKVSAGNRFSKVKRVVTNPIDIKENEKSFKYM